MEGLSIVVITALVIAFGSFSRGLERLNVTPAIFFVTTGLVVGTAGLGWLGLGIASAPVRFFAEATLTLVLFADASRIDLAALRRGAAVPARLLGIGLPLTIVAGTALAIPVLSGISPLEALVVAIVLAPTDAALGQAVVTDERLPSRIRQGLNVESGLNDGICVPLLLIALAAAETEGGSLSAGNAVHVVLEEIGWGLFGGAVAGVVGAMAIHAAIGKGLGEAVWVEVVPAATAALAYSLAVMLGGSGFIGAFVGGLAFGILHRKTGHEVTHLVEEGGALLNAVTFTLFGAAVLGPALSELAWAPLVYAVLSLTVIRMVPVAISMLRAKAALPTLGYLGWFGPRGLASIVFAVIVVEGAKLPHTHLLLVTVVLTIAVSVYAHGLTARPLTDSYVAWYGRHPAPPPMESMPAAEHRWRHRVPPDGNRV